MRYDNEIKCKEIREQLKGFGVEVNFDKVGGEIEVWTERGMMLFKNYAELRKALELALDLFLSFYYKGRWR